LVRDELLTAAPAELDGFLWKPKLGKCKSLYGYKNLLVLSGRYWRDAFQLCIPCILGSSPPSTKSLPKFKLIIYTLYFLNRQHLRPTLNGQIRCCI